MAKELSALRVRGSKGRGKSQSKGGKGGSLVSTPRIKKRKTHLDKKSLVLRISKEEEKGGVNRARLTGEESEKKRDTFWERGCGGKKRTVWRHP